MKNTPSTTSLPAISEFAIFESRPGVGIVLLPDAPKFTIVAVSNDFLQTSGMTRDQVIGKSLFEVFPESPGDPNFTGEQNIKDSFAYIIHYKVPHEIPVQRYDIPNGDGTFLQRYWRASNAPVLNNTGEVLYIIHTATDITDQVLLAEAKTAHLNLQTAYDQLNASEENFRLLVDTIRQSIWITDAEGHVEYLNKHWCDYCGEAFSPTTATEISIKHLHPEDGPKVMQAFGKAMQTGEPFEVEQRNRSKEGEYRWFLNRATPYKDPVTGKIIKWFGVGIDIHDRKLAEEAL
ncbi:MAG TPA: PAS domain S-box protein, partial [Flavisolibacter sp.]|nr:PAS domain S-box protein [Flavisolibacter sp.]